MIEGIRSSNKTGHSMGHTYPTDMISLYLRCGNKSFILFKRKKIPTLSKIINLSSSLFDFYKQSDYDFYIHPAELVPSAETRVPKLIFTRVPKLVELRRGDGA